MHAPNKVTNYWADGSTARLRSHRDENGRFIAADRIADALTTYENASDGYCSS
jgi:hypothetical protein